jgi:hypothetical protein
MQVRKEAGYTHLDNLVMAYKRPDGEFATVTKSVTVAMLKESPALRLAPTSAPTGPCKKGVGESKGKSESKAKGTR